MCETVTDSSDVSQCIRRFEHVKIRNTPETSVKRQPLARRLFAGTTPSAEHTHSAGPALPSADDKENSSSALSSPTMTMMIVHHPPPPQTTITAKPAKILRDPVKHCRANSQESGYGYGDCTVAVSPSEEPMECDAVTMTSKIAKANLPSDLRNFLSLTTTTITTTNNNNISRNENLEGTPKTSKLRWCLVLSPGVSVPPVAPAYEHTFDETIRGGGGGGGGESFFSSPAIDKLSTPPSSKSCKRPEANTPGAKHTQQSRISCSETAEALARIESAIERSTTDTDLIGDFSKRCVLPLLAIGRHEDLKSISAETLAGLIRGDFKDCIGSYTVIDCRYPYEYEGGHIDGAINLYSKDLIERRLLEPIAHNTPKIQPDNEKRSSILVFHCEFSWERGPNMSRFLRSMDRRRNKERYPALHYPELYLLHGGYEEFFKTQKVLCSPQGYKSMKHPDHQAELRQFRGKSKRWQAEKLRRSGLAARTNLKRLCF